jgi:hypothetical protein
LGKETANIDLRLPYARSCLQGTKIVEEIPHGKPIQVFQLSDTFGFQYSLQMFRWNFFDEHEHLDLSEFDARDSFLR